MFCVLYIAFEEHYEEDKETKSVNLLLKALWLNVSYFKKFCISMLIRQLVTLEPIFSWKIFLQVPIAVRKQILQTTVQTSQTMKLLPLQSKVSEN